MNPTAAASAPCALCINCANAATTGPSDRRRRIRCAAGILATESMFQCAHYVRVFRRRPAVPLPSRPPLR